MKHQEVDWITSNEQHVRSRIFDGLLPEDRAYQQLLSIEKTQRKAERSLSEARYETLSLQYIEAVKELHILRAKLGIPT